MKRCKRADGTIHQRINDTSEYGSYYQRISSSHSKWAVENLDFVRSVGTAKKAREYLYTQRWFFDQYD